MNKVFVVLALLAIGVAGLFFFQTHPLLSTLRSVNSALPFAFAAGMMTFLAGLVRYFTNTGQTKNNSPIRVMCWSLGALLVLACAWVVFHLGLRTFD